MGRPRHIVLTITSDPNYDQRMIRICNSLQQAGYEVTLIGRRRPGSKPLIQRSFKQIRIPQRIDRGKLFYLSFNLKLFFLLLFRRMDAICAIDLDTILPVYYASRIRRKPRVYDAHELFCEIEEVVSRPAIYRMWKWIERLTVPHFKHGYTVCQSIADEFRDMYGVDYGVVRNATVLRPLIIPEKKERYILYQGAVNMGRCFDELIPAMQWVDARLIICGEGNFYEEARRMTRDLGLEEKIIFKGYVPPEELPQYTLQATIGITLFVASSRSNELSLANRFFDYMHHGVPQLGVQYPEYEHINSRFEVAVLLPRPDRKSIAEALNRMLTDQSLYNRLQQNCLLAREHYCWQQEEQTLLATYRKLWQDHDRNA